MEPVVCPNGHPNRPGTRICAVCRALIPPVPASRPTATASPPPEQAAPPARRSGAVWWLLALMAALVVVVALAFLLFYPRRRNADYLATAAVVTMPGAPLPTVAALAVLPTAATDVTPVPPPAATSSPVSTLDPGASPTPVATITPLATITGMVLTPTLALPAAVPGPNLIQNGDFSREWVDGWERQVEGLNGVQVVEERLLTGEPPLPTLHIGKTGAGMLRVVQHVGLTGSVEELVFRSRLRLAGVNEPSGAEGRSALILLYENADGDPLGASVWLDSSASTSGLWGGGLPAFGPMTALRLLEPGWQTVEINLRREFIDRLPDVDAAAVRRITVVLTVVAGPGCPPDGCPAELDVADLSLVVSEPPE